MIKVVFGFGVPLLWWSAWTTYIRTLQRTNQLSKFRSYIYDVCTIVSAISAIALGLFGLAPFSASSFATSLRVLLGAIIVGVLMLAAQVVALWVVHFLCSTPGRPGQSRYPNQALWLLPITGAAEEVLFRGCLLSALIMCGLPPGMAVCVTAALFGVIHISQFGWYGVLLHSCTGLVFGLLALKFGFVAAIATHATFNLFAWVVNAWKRRLRCAALSEMKGERHSVG